MCSFQLGALEAQYSKMTGDLTSFSVQEILDCSHQYGNNGCVGGNPAMAYEYAFDQRGLRLEADYPYVGRNNTCPYNVTSAYNANTVSFIVVEEREEEAVRVAVATIGPVSAGIDASFDSIRFYSEGD